MLLNPEIIDKGVLVPTTEVEKDNYVAIAVQLGTDNLPGHVGLVVNYEKKRRFFHFTISRIKFEDFPIDQEYFYKKIQFIRKEEIEWFLARCEMISESIEQNPKFGFICDGSIFNAEGRFVSPIEGHNVSNCVFFCISVISGFLTDRTYFQIEDWGPDVEAIQYFKSFVFKNLERHLTEENRDKVVNAIRRIPPADYFTSAFNPDLPIKKKEIDQYSKMVSNVLIQRKKKLSPISKDSTSA